MKKFVIILPILLFKLILSAQSIYFTTRNTLGDDVFFKVDVNQAFVYENVSSFINGHALYSGANKGPLTVSHNGNYLVFSSDQFANSTVTGGYEAITICSSDFSTFEVPVNASGSAFHSEGIMQISDDGQTVYFVQGDGTHGRDIFKISRNGAFWTDPIELSTASTFDFNIAPYLSYDETKLIFEASNDQSLNTNISQVMNDGSNLENVTSISQIANAIQLKSPCYDLNNNVFLEIETDSERIWKINVGGSPEIINSSYTNDNSPVTLPDGRVVSVYIPSSTHEIKVMDNSGVNLSMLTQTNSQFDEVFDIGISAGGSSVSNITQIDNPLFTIYPNPSQNELKINKNNDFTHYKIYDNQGKVIQADSFIPNMKNETLYHNLKPGIYVFEAEDNNGKLMKQQLVII